MSETVKKQILIIRDTGLTNMFDILMVERIANDMGFYELFAYLDGWLTFKSAPGSLSG